ncbi:hypothetical protein EKD04_022245 [Chloroflexales bacterium ZM16-3]|nr:hypothetical protein [Chloroflexales bacterium ZM16-3]
MITLRRLFSMVSAIAPGLLAIPPGRPSSPSAPRSTQGYADLSESQVRAALEEM